uniref:Uncharacterized protein n=1 Tax=Chlamydomonas euryale TaxID=1486919 RepID=A0A7R9Z2H4_9CHLO|mmetsp:Transcript_4234/g.12196  ORF Transcript_4234/g.12196 Transcript_4234/m.12196 type:complete len:149 (+) Transcript_4234:892-1338(+)
MLSRHNVHGLFNYCQSLWPVLRLSQLILAASEREQARLLPGCVRGWYGCMIWMPAGARLRTRLLWMPTGARRSPQYQQGLRAVSTEEHRYLPLPPSERMHPVAALRRGTIAVYSCRASCEIAPDPPADGQEGPGSAYAEEYVWVQPAL